MQRDNRPPLQRLADHLLDGHLEDFVRSRRAEGKSWRDIEHDLDDTVDVRVAAYTINTWYPDDAEPEPAPKPRGKRSVA